jgi:hypothetical protein
MATRVPDIWKPAGGRTERDVAAEVCVRILQSGLVPRTPQTIARMAAGTGVPIDMIRQAWALHEPGRRSSLGQDPVKDGEDLPPTNRVGNVKSIRPAKEPHEKKVHEGKPPAKRGETAQERFDRRLKSRDHVNLLRKEPRPGMRVCDGKLCKGQERPFSEFVKKGDSYSSWCRACLKVYQSERFLTSKQIAKLGPVLEFVLADGDEHVGAICIDCEKPCQAGETVLAGVLTMGHARHYSSGDRSPAG